MRCAAPSFLAFLAALVLIAACGEKEEPATTGPVVPAPTQSTTSTESSTTPSSPPQGPSPTP